jgi:Ca2+-binding RTX toxin-like protein
MNFPYVKQSLRTPSSSAAGRAAPPYRRKPLLEALEPRLLLSADVSAAAAALSSGLQDLGEHVLDFIDNNPFLNTPLPVVVRPLVDEITGDASTVAATLRDLLAVSVQQDDNPALTPIETALNALDDDADGTVVLEEWLGFAFLDKITDHLESLSPAATANATALAADLATFIGGLDAGLTGAGPLDITAVGDASVAGQITFDVDFTLAFSKGLPLDLGLEMEQFGISFPDITITAALELSLDLQFGVFFTPGINPVANDFFIDEATLSAEVSASADLDGASVNIGFVGAQILLPSSADHSVELAASAGATLVDPTSASALGFTSGQYGVTDLDGSIMATNPTGDGLGSATSFYVRAGDGRTVQVLVPATDDAGLLGAINTALRSAGFQDSTLEQTVVATLDGSDRLILTLAGSEHTALGFTTFSAAGGTLTTTEDIDFTAGPEFALLLSIGGALPIRVTGTGATLDLLVGSLNNAANANGLNGKGVTASNVGGRLQLATGGASLEIVRHITVDSKFSKSDLTAASLGDLFQLDHAGSVDIDVPIEVKLGLEFSLPTPAQISFSGDPFDVGLPALDSIGNLKLPLDLQLSHFDELLNFNNLSASSFISLLGQLRDWMGNLNDTEFFSTEIPLANMTVGDVLNFVDMLQDALLFDDLDDDNDATGTPKLLDAENNPTFATAQELKLELIDILGLSNVSGVAYDAASDELTYTIKLSNAFAPEDIDLNFSLADLGLNLGPLVDVSTDSTLHFAADGSLSLKLGVYLGPSGLSDLLSNGTLLAELNEDTGAGIKDELAVTAAAAPTSIVGRLTEDASFRLRVGGEGPITVNLSAASTSTNTTIANLVADLQAAINLTSLNGDVTVGSIGNRITLSTTAAVTVFEVLAETTNPAVTQLGLQPQLVEKTVAEQISVIAGKDAPTLVGRLSGNAVFNVSIGVDAAVPVTVLKADTDANSTILDLVDDVNAALAGQIAGGNVSSFELADDATFSVTLDSDNAMLDQTVNVTVRAADARLIGFVQNQTANGTLVANYAAPASAVLAADMTFLLQVGVADPVVVHIEREETSGFGVDRAQLATRIDSAVDAALTAAGVASSVDVAFDGGTNKFTFTTAGSTKLKILSAGTTQGNANLGALATDVNNALQNALQAHFAGAFEGGIVPTVLEARASGSSIVFSTVNPSEDFNDDDVIDETDVNPNAINSFSVDADVGNPADTVLKIPTSPATAQNLADRFVASAAGTKLVITAIDDSITEFTVTASGAPATTGLGLGSAVLTGNDYDLMIQVKNTTFGNAPVGPQTGKFFISLDGLTTIGEVIAEINSETGGHVTASISEDGTKLLLQDDSASGSGNFHVEAINGSAAAARLGILRGDITNPAQTPDGLIEGATLAGLTLTDRFFIDDAVVKGSFGVSTPGGLSANATFGFVGVELDGDGSLFGSIEAGLKAPGDTEAGGKITLTELLDAFAGPDADPGDILATPVVLGGGDLDLTVAVQPFFDLGMGVSPSISIELDKLGNPFAPVFGTNSVANGVIPLASGAAEFQLTFAGTVPATAVNVSLAAGDTTGNTTLHQLAADLQTAIRTALAEDLGTDFQALVRVDALGDRLFITAIDDRVTGFQVGTVNETATTELGLYAGTGDKLPKLDVDTSDVDLGSLVDFSNVGLEQILAALGELAEFLGGLEGFGFLNADIPLVNVSINDVLEFAERFGEAVDDLQSNPAGSLQLLEGKLKEALGIAPTSDVIDLELAEGNIFKISLGLDAGFTTSLPINFDLGAGLPFDLAGAGSIQADGTLDISLDFGLDLDDPLNLSSIVLYESSGIVGELNLGSDNLSFRAAVGPLGVYISGGEVSVGGNLASEGGTSALDLFQLGFDFDGEDFLPVGTVLGALGTYLDVDLGGEVSVNLPVFFPTESSHRGYVRFDAGLGYSLGGGLQVTGDLLPQAYATDGTTVIGIGELFVFDPSNASLLDNILLAIDGIDMFLAGLQDVMDGEVFGVSIPLIGDQLGGAAQFIADFREDFIGIFREEVENLTSPTDNIISVKLFELLGPGGLGILLDGDDDGTDISATDVELDPDDTYIQWNLRIGGPIVNASAGIGFDLGIPGIGLEAEGDIDLQIDWELAFGFGLSLTDGFYIDISDTSELQLDIEVTLPDAALTGRLAFLQVRAEDDGTRLGLGFAIDINNRNDAADERLSLGELGSLGLGIKVAAEADVNLHLSLGLNEEMFPSVAASFPEIVAHFVLEWGVENSVFDFDESNGRQHTYFDGSLSELPNAIMDGLEYVAFEDVGLDLGSFLTDVLAPIVGEVQKVTQPIQPIIEVLTTPIPVISDLAGPTTLLDLAAAFAKGKFDVGLIKAVADVITLINAIPIPEEGEDLVITFGSFVVLDDSASVGGDLDLSNPNTASTLKNLPTPTGTDFKQALAAKPASASKSFTQKLSGGGFGDGFSFPILTDPSQVFGLLMGKEATLIEYDMPALVFDFTYTQFFSIFGPLGVSITGNVGATIDFSFGYDTAGIKHFVDTGFKNPALLFDGFYVGDLDDNGKDIPELQLRAGISAAAELNLGVARAGVAGGIFAVIDFDLHDPNQDGKVRIYEIVTNVLNQAKYGEELAFLAPLAVFDVSGEIFAKLFAFLKIDLFFFSIDKEFDITPPITIVDFEIPFTRVPALATEIDGGILQLNLGQFAGERLEGDKTDGNEQFFVKQGAGNNVLVWAPSLGVTEGMAQEYEVTTRIVANGGEGDDLIDVSRVTANIEFDLQGGVGNDQIYLSNADYTVAAPGVALIRGGAGDDRIRGGGGADVIHGEQGNDNIGGGGGADIIFGDAGEVSGQSMTVTFSTKDGNDTIDGGDGNDILLGGGGNDVITGGGNNDVIVGDGGRVFFASGAWVAENTNKDEKGGKDTLSGGAGNDLVYGGKGNDTLNGDDGDDRLYGEDGADTINGGANADTIYGGIGDDTIDAGSGNDLVYAEDGIDTVDGGAGDDILWGGRGADTLRGGTGDDELYGQTDPDLLIGGAGSDRLVGGFGNDVVYGDDGVSEGAVATLSTVLDPRSDLILAGFGSDTIDGQGGRDVVLISTRGGRTNDLTTIYDTGANADGVDELRIDGTGEDDVFLLRAMASPTGAAFVAKLNSGGAQIERFNYKGIEGLEVNGYSGDDLFVSDDTRAIAALNGGIGDDKFQIGQMFKSERDDNPQTANLADDDVFATVETTRGWLSNGITFPMTINGGIGNDEFVVFRNIAVLTLNGGDGDDLFTVRAFALAGSQEDDRARTDLKGDAGADTIMYAVNAPVGIDGGDGFDTILVIGTEFSDDFVITDNGVFGGGLNVTYVNIERLKVDGAEGDDRYFVLSTDASVVTEIAGGLGSDTFFIGGTPTGEPIPVISNDLKGHSGVILNSIESVEGGSYNDLKIDGVSANVADDDEPFIVVTPSGGVSTVTEDASGGGEGWAYDTYRVALTRGPDEDVVISIVSPAVAPEDRAQGSKSLEFWNGASWVSTLQLTFTTLDWETSQEVRFRAASDDASEGTRFAVINHMVVSGSEGDPGTYNALPMLSVKVQINDDDRAGVIVTPTGSNTMVVETAEGGSHTFRQDEFNVVLSREPTDDVRVWMDPRNDQVTLSGTGVVNNGDGRWYIDYTDGDFDSAVTVTLTASVDAIREGFHSDYIEFEVESLDVDTHASEDETIDYDETTLAQEDIPEDDPKGFVLLQHAPDTSLPVSLTINGVVQAAARYQVVGNTLVFLNQEGNPENRSGRIEVSYQYVVPGYDGAFTRPVVVDVYDDDAPSVIVVESGGSTDVVEGGATDTVQIVLSKAPVGDETVRVYVQPVKTRSTGGDAPAYFEFQVTVDGPGVVLDGSRPYVTFDSTNWNVAKTITVTAINDAFIDGSDTQVFAPGPQTVNKIRGPLFVEGAAGEGSISLPEPLLLPGELNFRPSDGAISTYTAGENEAPDRITVAASVLQAIVDEDLGDDVEAIADLIGRTFEIVGDPVAVDQSAAVDRFWRIEDITGAGATLTLHLKNPSQKPDTWGNPEADDLFAITDLADTFFVAEEDQIDFMMVFDNDSVADDVGAMYEEDVDPADDGVLMRGRLTGLGMGPDAFIGGALRLGGITFGDMEVVRVDLGKGSDTLDVSYATKRPADDKRPDFFTQTIINTGEGDDTVTVELDDEDGAFAVDAGDGNDLVDARDSTRQVVIFGGTDNDALFGGSGGDIIFGDRGRVDYVNADGQVITRLGHTIVVIPTSPATGSTSMTLIDSDGYDADRDGVDETFFPTDDDGLKGLVVTITSGTGLGQSRIITGNTAYTIFVDAAWETLPDATSTYRISFLPEDQTDGTHRGARLILSTDFEVGGNDYIDGGAGANVLIGGSNGSGLPRELAGVVTPAFAGDQVVGGDSADTIFGDNARIDFDPVEGKDGETVAVLLQSIALAVGGADDLTGGEGGDWLFGGAGGDAIHGGEGGDIVFGDNGRIVRPAGAIHLVQTTDDSPATGGDDAIDSGDGDDIVFGGVGGDDIDAGEGDDIVLGDNGLLNYVSGDADATTLDLIESDLGVAGGNDDLDTGAGDDVVIGGGGDDEINAWAGRDVVLGDNGRVRNFGGNRDHVETTDTAASTTGADTIDAGADDDVVLGGGNGEDGQDHLNGGAGNDIVLGDNGRLDYLLVADLDLDVVATADPAFGGGDLVNGNGGNDLILGGAGGDEIHGDAGDDLILGDNGRLEFAGTMLHRAVVTDPTVGGDDTIEGNGGNDVVVAGTGGDTASGDTAGADTSAVDDGNDVLFGDHAEIVYNLAAGGFGAVDPTRPWNVTPTAIYTAAGDGAGGDILFGNGADDMLLGQQGADLLFGGDGDDDVWGGHNVSGGTDAGDTIDAGTGFDVVLGDNGYILRRADTQSPLYPQLAGATVFDGVQPGMGATPHMGAGDFTRDITVLDHADDTNSDVYGADAIAGGAGDDLLFGQLGNDTVQGDGRATVDITERTAAMVFGEEADGDGDGDDYIEGNGGADLIYGNLGQDDIIGGSSDLFGLALVTQRPDGDDTIYGGAGTDAGRYHADDNHARDADVILGDNARIFKVVNADGEYLFFNYGELYVAAEGQRIIPRAYELMDYTPGNTGSPATRHGADLVFGESGDDIIHGMAGDDILFGNAGDDDLYGENGDDWMSGGDGVDGMLGDDGRIYTSRNGETELLYGVTTANEQDIIATPGNWLSETIYASGQLLKSVELEPWEEGGDDVMYGGLGGDFMHGGEGTDGMSGAEALQEFYDGAVLRNQTRIDAVLHYNATTSKFDEFDNTQPLAKIEGFFLNFEASIAGVKVSDGDDRLFGDLGHDWLVGGTNEDHLYGGLGDDVLNGDDNLETSGTDSVEGEYGDADIAYGGGGRDQLIANTGADRLIDWAGEFNAYWVPFSPYGQGTVSRNVAPHVPEFLYALSKAGGADQTLGTDPARNGEPYGELGLVLQQDPFWNLQTGGPNDPQAGNGKSKKDIQR